ncbi:endo-1,4-beta-xylanase [Altererythrobacter sp. Root672]|uniref:endo-1,4-beta-xylanase n=1 Tax=Altererythrobacter sp. Root672 TaxID=1736584 RepID=UPI0006FC0238|nr:endo-1,4-beta-xylanase [Altererythrobacter sp. Root672]KRA80596.1 glycosyl hydrolase [Altererythrobacter sp. Root672]
MSPALAHTTRRNVLAGMAALPVAAHAASSAVAATPAPAGEGSGLSALAQRKGRRFGSAINWNKGTAGGSIQNPNYTRIIKAECGIVVPENEMKWQWTRPGPDKFDFARMDDIVRWTQANGIAIRGHTLLWHRPKWFPDWLNTYDFGANPVQEAERLLTTHIRTVTDRYRGVITSYDVVNEAIDHDTNGLMETSLSRAMRGAEGVLDLAFHTAREQLPDAELVYNDYMSWEPPHAKHCADVLRLLEGFRKRNVPVDTLGIQSHIENFSIDPATGVGPYREREWRQFLDEAVAMGYKLLITEFDVKDKALPAAIPERDAKVAEFARRYFEVMLDYEQLGDILAWGMVDKYSWLQGFAPRDDGLEVRCCPYDSEYRAKPLRDAIAQTLGAAAP